MDPSSANTRLKTNLKPHPYQYCQQQRHPLTQASLARPFYFSLNMSDGGTKFMTPIRVGILQLQTVRLT